MSPLSFLSVRGNTTEEIRCDPCIKSMVRRKPGDKEPTAVNVENLHEDTALGGSAKTRQDFEVVEIWSRRDEPQFPFLGAGRSGQPAAQEHASNDRPSAKRRRGRPFLPPPPSHLRRPERYRARRRPRARGHCVKPVSATGEGAKYTAGSNECEGEETACR